jgi:hypothetical protein
VRQHRARRALDSQPAARVACVLRMALGFMQRTLQDLASGYLKHFETKADEYWWAWQEVDKLVRGSTSEASSIAAALVVACKSEEQLAYVAAGPIEDILCRDAAAYLIIDKECKRSSKFLRAVQLTYMDESDESFQRWKALLLENPLDSRNDT